MKYDEIKDRPSADFQRLTGVKPQVFEQMLQALQNQIRSFGRPCKLCLADHWQITGRSLADHWQITGRSLADHWQISCCWL
jgi:hypothetical protein